MFLNVADQGKNVNEKPFFFTCFGAEESMTVTQKILSNFIFKEINDIKGGRRASREILFKAACA